MTGARFVTPSRLRRGDVFTYIGAFEQLVAITDAVDDPEFPGRLGLVVVTVDPARSRQVVKRVRLRAEQPCHVVGSRVDELEGLVGRAENLEGPQV